MRESEIDRMFHIKTRKVKDWEDLPDDYNHYEATPYSILNTLFEKYPLQRNDTFVDFGCGKGRVLFYAHERFQVAVTGVEMNKELYEEARINKQNYITNVSNNSAPIRLVHNYAESYDIQADENRFYFFNPFSIHIFRQVVENVMQSAIEHPRDIDLILYYPPEPYVDYLQEETSFTLFDEVPVKGLYEINKSERFLIYRLSPLK